MKKRKEGINSRLADEKQISDMEDKVMEITQLKHQKE